MDGLGAGTGGAGSTIIVGSAIGSGNGEAAQADKKTVAARMSDLKRLVIVTLGTAPLIQAVVGGAYA